MNEKRNMPLTRDRIIDASWNLLRQDNLESFTMRKLANQLGIKAASLYWHFPSKQHIFQFLANEIALTIRQTAPKRGDWKQQLYLFGMNFRAQLEKYPCAAQLMMQTIPLDTEYLALMNDMLNIVEPLPLSDDDKFSSAVCIVNYVLSFELDQYQRHKNDVAIRQATGEVGEQFEHAMNNLPNPLQRMYHNGIFSELGSDRMFQTGLTIQISGIEQLISNPQKDA